MAPIPRSLFAFRLLPAAFALFAVSLFSASSARAADLYLVDVSGANLGDRLRVVSLQGLANRRAEGPFIYTLSNPADGAWLAVAQRLRPDKITVLAPPELISKLASQVAKGQVIFDPQAPYTINVATTFAGLEDAVVTDTDLGLKTLLDTRQRWPEATAARQWATEQLLPRCSNEAIGLLQPEQTAVRDLMVARRIFVTEPGEAEYVGSLLRHLRQAAAVFGPATLSSTAAALVDPASGRSCYLAGGGAAANLSFHALVPARPPLALRRPYIEPSNRTAICFIVGGGEDVSRDLRRMEGLWDDPARGTLPLGWTLSPQLSRLAPDVLQDYFIDAYRSATDEFVVGPSGLGMAHLARDPAAAASIYEVTQFLRQSGIATVVLAQPGDRQTVGAVAAQFGRQPPLRGLFVMDSSVESGFRAGVPVVPAIRGENVPQIVEALKAQRKRRAAYVAVYVDPTALTPSDILAAVTELGDGFTVVLPTEFFELVEATDRYPTAPPKPATIEAVLSLDPGAPQPTEPVRVAARLDSAGLISVKVLYASEGGAIFEAQMEPSGDGFAATLPPFLAGGKVNIWLYAAYSSGLVALSPPATLSAPAKDSDSDGLTDAEEAAFLTDPDNPDTDGDGLLDGNDPRLLIYDKVVSRYFGPLAPPNDHPYLVKPGKSTVDAAGRHLPAGDSCLYWLPLDTLPTGIPARLELAVGGEASVAFSSDGETFGAAAPASVGIDRYPVPPAALAAKAVFLRISAGGAGATVYGLSVVGDPDAPSIAGVEIVPTYPKLGVPTVLRATVFSSNGISSVSAGYEIEGRGSLTVPMTPVGNSQTYQVTLAGVENRDRLRFWVSAVDPQGHRSGVPAAHAHVGTTAREMITLLPVREFHGDWRRGADWYGLARISPKEGAVDKATALVDGGRYDVWVLCGGRGKSIEVRVDGQTVGRTHPDLPDGWQKLGPVRIKKGLRTIELVSGGGGNGSPEAAPRYGEVILSADALFAPPVQAPLDFANSLMLLSPGDGSTVSGATPIVATAAGNIAWVEVRVDRQPLPRKLYPPYEVSWNTRRVPDGEHEVEVVGISRAGRELLGLTITVQVSNKAAP